MTRVSKETRSRRWSLDQAASALETDRDRLFEWLERRRYAYRYTGVGRKLAYVHWIRCGLFENGPHEMIVTERGMNLLRHEFVHAPSQSEHPIRR